MEKSKKGPSEKESKILRTSSKMEIPYPEVCRRRYAAMKLKYNKQFCKELEQLEKMQPDAHQAMRFHRHFTITTFWPPLHSRQEIDWTMGFFQDPLTKEQRRRVEKILSERKYSWLN